MAKNRSKKHISVAFVALGCPKNIVDSERMLAEIAQAGLIITADLQSADVIIINTCGFIEPAKQEAFDEIKNAVNRKTSGRVKKVIVAGCLSQRMGQQLFEQIDGIDAVVGLGQRDDIAQIIKQTLNSTKPRTYLAQSCQTVTDDRTRLLITPPHSAYLRISEGCDHKCSFCTIPAIRGRFRSKPQKHILAEACELVEAGVVELNVIAQDTAYYGRDFKIKNGLASLITEIEKIDRLKWLRLMYLYPAGFNQHLIETIAESQKIVHYFDIPIQHISDKILTDMKRPDSKEQIIKLIENLRKAIPDIVLRTTLIVGFPGETDSQFTELLEFIEWARFDALGCFQYYPETGTPAALMPNQIPDNIKQQRVRDLMLTQQEIAFEKNAQRIGTELTCLIDSAISKNSAKGRFYGQAPEIDGICIIKNCSAPPGSFIQAKVTDSKQYDLLVEKI